MLAIDEILSRYDPSTGALDGKPAVRRHLADLRGCFADVRAYESALERGNPLVYSVAAVEPARGEGDLGYGIGLIVPGKVGREYHMTKGHLHAWRPAAEFYFGLSGEGVMLLEDEATGASRMVRLRPHEAVYVPGHTAHRTMNVGAVPLTYLGVYPARAGHDYGAIAERNFRGLVVESGGQPTLVDRASFIP
ncbi:glucose-6-phosphate isomerase family protein [Aquisphaera insulae]|uniref:glucose-6-phosphate isomerase family protein n=1 Tax=Aquisphaera insulae TaxID=2712864 RepID=UPI0013ECCCFB|nr:glucose-6-phosphate isomerase family protein [Aquisphaera insulae]